MKGFTPYENFLLLKAEYVVTYEKVNRKKIDFKIHYKNGWITIGGDFSHKCRMAEFRSMLNNLKNRKVC